MHFKKTLYIHAGMGKTGTTSIQNMFHQHRNYFRKNGIFYPSTGTTICHHDIASGYLEFENQFWKIADNFIELLKREIETIKPKKCLLSSELFYFLLDRKEFAEVIKDIFNDYNIQIIVYIRRADKLLPSAYKQQVMGFRYRELNKKFQYVNHIEKLAGIKAALGIENSDIIIRPFEKQQFHQNNLLKDFLNIVGIEDSDNVSEKIPPAKIKTNLNLDIIEYARQMSVSVNHLKPVELSAWHQLLADYPCPKKYEDVSLFGSYENLEDTMNCYAPMYEHIAHEYLCREDGKMFYEDPPPDKENFKPYSGLSIEKIIRINGYLNYKIRQECITQIKTLKKWTLRNLIATIINRVKVKIKRPDGVADL